MLFYGASAQFAQAASEPAGPPVPGRQGVAPATTVTDCEAGDGNCKSTDVPAPAPKPASGKTMPGGGNKGSGGVAPKPAGGKKTDNDADSGDVTPTTGSPDFVEQDDDLTGGVSPNLDGETPNTDPLKVSPLSVPNFVIDRFEIPPFLLPIYQACGTEYGIPWTVLASINRIETAFGTNLSTSYAGALGWMQFLDSSWRMFGVDANGDGIKDPYNPVDAICAAANYLKIAGYAEDPRKAIFAYNHADWYVNDILEHAEEYAKIPTEVISALTGLTEGARFPVAAESTYAGQLSTEQAKRKGLASQKVDSSKDRASVEIEAAGGSPVIAVNDGIVTAIDPATGTVTIKDAYDNRYSYARLGSVAKVHPVPQARSAEDATAGDSAPADSSDNALANAEKMGSAKAQDDPRAPVSDAKKPKSQVEDETSDEISEVLVDPETAARAADEAAVAAPDDQVADDQTESTESASPVAAAESRRSEQSELADRSRPVDSNPSSEDARGRVYANPLRPQNQKRSSIDGQSVNNAKVVSSESAGVDGKPGDYVIYDGSRSGIYRFDQETAKLQMLRKGSRVIAGTVLGRLSEGTANGVVEFSIQPGGEDTPRIDPKPFLDGWRLLAETNIYNAKGGNRFADRLGIGGVLLLSKPALQRRVLADPGLDIYECGRQDIASGFTDRRILAMLSFLREKGFTMTITSLTCGHGVYSTSGNVSQHTTGTAVDIAIFNGQVVTAGVQGAGSYTDQAARAVMSLQGAMTPDQVISLMDYNNGIGFAMGNHDDHLHVGYRPVSTGDAPGSVSMATLGAKQWQRLTERLGEIRNPEVPTDPSRSSLPAGKPDKDE